MEEREGKVGVKILLEELGFDDLFLLCLEYIHTHIYIYIYLHGCRFALLTVQYKL